MGASKRTAICVLTQTFCPQAMPVRGGWPSAQPPRPSRAPRAQSVTRASELWRLSRPTSLPPEERHTTTQRDAVRGARNCASLAHARLGCGRGLSSERRIFSPGFARHGLKSGCQRLERHLTSASGARGAERGAAAAAAVAHGMRRTCPSPGALSGRPRPRPQRRRRGRAPPWPAQSPPPGPQSRRPAGGRKGAREERQQQGTTLDGGSAAPYAPSNGLLLNPEEAKPSL